MFNFNFSFRDIYKYTQIRYEQPNLCRALHRSRSPVNEQRIRSAKLEREQLFDNNRHLDQCSSIPEIIDHQKHGIHLEPCYKKFTSILAKKAKQSTPNPEKRSSARLTPVRDFYSPALELENKNVYPNECNYCKKYQLKHKQKIQFPKTITTSDAVSTIKAVAKQNNTDLYYEIKVSQNVGN